MADTNKESDSGTLLRNVTEKHLQQIAEEITDSLCKSYSTLQTIRKYALRKGADHLIKSDTEGQTPYQVDIEGLSREILSLLANLLTGPNIDALLGEAIRAQDIGQIKAILVEKCRSALAGGARNPRFRAIRAVLHLAAQEGTVSYRPGLGLYPKPGESVACYAFSPDSDIEIIRGAMDAESFQGWPPPPFLQEMPSETADIKMTQKELILKSAFFFWDEAVRRFGPCMVRIFDLLCYMESNIPPSLIASLLPDPLADSASLHVHWDSKPVGREIEGSSKGEIEASMSLWKDLYPEEEVDKPKLQEIAAQHAKTWLNGLTAKRAAIFCIMLFCEYGLTRTARNLGLGSAQLVSYHYKKCLDDLKCYCSRHPGLSPPDENPALFRMFSELLRDFCEDDVLKGGCE